VNKGFMNVILEVVNKRKELSELRGWRRMLGNTRNGWRRL
jgi:hypothetical protein